MLHLLHSLFSQVFDTSHQAIINQNPETKRGMDHSVPPYSLSPLLDWSPSGCAASRGASLGVRKSQYGIFPFSFFFPFLDRKDIRSSKKPEKLKNEIKKLLPDKSSSPSGITNRMLQAGDTGFQGLILILFNGLWEFQTQPSDWELSLYNPSRKKQQAKHPTEAYISMTPSLNSSKVSSLPD